MHQYIIMVSNYAKALLSKQRFVHNRDFHKVMRVRYIPIFDSPHQNDVSKLLSYRIATLGASIPPSQFPWTSVPALSFSPILNGVGRASSFTAMHGFNHPSIVIGLICCVLPLHRDGVEIEIREVCILVGEIEVRGVVTVIEVVITIENGVEFEFWAILQIV